MAEYQCSACLTWVDAHDLADPAQHDTGSEQSICLDCHYEIIASDSDLSCPGCQQD